MRWIIYILFFPLPCLGQEQKVGASNVGIKVRAWLDTEMGTFSKGRPVWVDSDTMRTAWLSTKYYTDSLYKSYQGSLTVTGTTTKTISVTKSDGGAWLSGSFTDMDNQTLSYNSGTLSISGGNSVSLPVDEFFHSTGSTSQVYVLPSVPHGNVVVMLNAGFLSPSDYSITGNTLTFSINIESTDHIFLFTNKL